MAVEIITADCRIALKTIIDGTVHCVVTSPPYWGLRDYGVAGQIGLENAPDHFIAEIVAVFREIHRVLRNDGVVWLNLGDSYNAQQGKQNLSTSLTSTRGGGHKAGSVAYTNTKRPRPPGLKPKDLVGMPWRVALALQADGWYLRQDIIWHKSNPMPESVKDRCTKAHEYLFLLAKNERYYFDADAIKEPWTSGRDDMRRHGIRTGAAYLQQGPVMDNSDKGPRAAERDQHDYQGGRNKRSVWTIATKPYREAHFATFPPALVEPCVKAGTSEHGCCSACGAPYMRLQRRVARDGTEVVLAAGDRFAKRPDGSPLIGDNRIDAEDQSNRHPISTMPLGTRASFAASRGVTQNSDMGWAPSCTCEAGVVPCTVLDPFGGAGTVGVVAEQLGRDSILIELNPAYVEIAQKRIDELVTVENFVNPSLSCLSGFA